METNKAFVERSSEIANQKELTKSTYEEAIRRAVEASIRAASFRRKAAELSALSKELGSLAYTYAVEHSTALTEPLVAIKDRTQSGSVTFDDGSVYSLTVGLGDPKRIDGSNITKSFMQTLPKEWTKTKTELAVDAVKSAEPAEREEYGLVCQMQPSWKLSEK